MTIRATIEVLRSRFREVEQAITALENLAECRLAEEFKNRTRVRGLIPMGPNGIDDGMGNRRSLHALSSAVSGRSHLRVDVRSEIGAGKRS